MPQLSPQTCLQKYFSYPSFRPGQLPIIEAILQRQNTLAILPTGGGKSLCFQIPGLILPGITLVISPLISLMKDQVDALKQRGIRATFLNSSLKKTELTKRLSAMQKGSYKFIYLAPERLANKKFLQTCHNLKKPINLLAIDEAHCISLWGHDFRPSYLKIKNFVHQLPTRPVLAAFTATATEPVRTDIKKQLQLQKPKVFLNSFRRENLSFHVTQCQNSFQQELALFKLLKQLGVETQSDQAGIIYTATQKKATYLARLIKHYWGQNWPIAAYHGGLENEQRAQIQDQFIANQLQVITATNAFGMGVDKPNVRWVIHFHMPGNLENYYQEAGRAGRDGQPARCYLLFNPQDLQIQHLFINQSHPDPQTQRHQYQLQQLKAIQNYALTSHCRQSFILNYFAENSQPCHQCDNCLQHQLELTIQEKTYQQKIINLRNQLSAKTKIEPNLILTPHLIQLLTIHQPQTKTEFSKIPGIGYGWLEKWYNHFRYVHNP